MVNLSLNLKKFFSEGHERTLMAKKNIAFSFLLKGGSVIVVLLMVPLCINYVDPTQYGIWITLSSIIGWFNYFDIGFGNGLKNKLTEAIANKDDVLAKSYVSTAYVALCIISGSFLSIFLVANNFLDWARILNAPATLAPELSLVAFILFIVFFMQFVLQLVNVVCEARQKAFLQTFIIFSGNLLGLIIVFILTKTTEGSLFKLCLAIGISPLVVLILFSLLLFGTTFKKYAPSFSLARYVYAKDIMSVGLKFFIIQVGLLFFYFSHNIIITQVIGPAAVTSYNVAFRYFGVITMLSVIVMAPFWPAFTEAHVKKDFEWIKSTVKRLKRLCLILLGLSLMMLAASSEIYKLWIGEEVEVPFALSLVLSLYVTINAYRTIFHFYLNGTGKIKLQLFITLIAGLLNIPLAIVLGKWLGVPGVVLSTVLLCALASIIEVRQYKKLISNEARGIWNQ